ncbi:MAG: ATP-binding cassette domain-containing protein, partial [Bacteroidaceae bacterium]|nr:ATP-binding cassette domain-containing protein [Bacteroidaceae bacterium]
TIGFTGGYFVALVWGLFQLQSGMITVGVLMAFTQLISRIQRPLIDMARMFPMFVNSFASAERLIELEELPLEKELQPVKLLSPAGVRFDNVSYKYSEKGRMVLAGFSHEFKPGSFTAILGETGAGKTTLIRLMLSLLSPTSGKVTICNGEREVDASVATRCNFSYVPQGNTLFSGTIRDNLMFGNPEATEKQIKDAISIAMAEFVYDLHEGIDTVCGENGGGLSEGQAQRIAIARALVRPCRILLLDEATSALDIETERHLLQNIKKFMSDTTIIFVTHRLAVVEFTSDQITMRRTTDN